jgi:hypothetical protein
MTDPKRVAIVREWYESGISRLMSFDENAAALLDRLDAQPTTRHIWIPYGDGERQCTLCGRIDGATASDDLSCISDDELLTGSFERPLRAEHDELVAFIREHGPDILDILGEPDVGSSTYRTLESLLAKFGEK